MVRWGLLGAGEVIEKKVLPAFASVSGSQVYGVAKRSYEEALSFAKKYSIQNVYETYERLMEDKNIDIVYISTPPGFHLEHAKKCADFGKPVYLEKPFARNFAEAKEISEYFQSRGIPLCIAHYRRAHPKFLEIKKMITSGELGKVVWVNSTLFRTGEDISQHSWMGNPKISGGGKFFDIAPHLVDLLVFFFGNFSSITGKTNIDENTHTEANVFASFAFENGGVGSLAFSSVSSVKVDTTTICFEKGMIEFQVHGQEDSFFVTKNQTREVRRIYPSPNLQSPMIEQFGKYISHQISENPCRPEDVLEVYRFIDEALNDAYENRSGKFWGDN